ncbi:transcriptional regulator, RpiR family [Beutenbergia cavernae DSM 12333]|uniref:Transcriptional regulator, RpiR family n=1 Tax=Beutenbergia cavernae (strain ATCC BAA-8 / DSM 12333 / CCUG 43141 / JCM 11478 / NBRC 16432 / NCIMB 13614 / HKI 0122) TaxID=471853 RepID=C5BWC4_BEUC1|nr:MurR/RpiR family transcriptional regulator [Beutenbergia cavernae]ACQ78582.1 transcriptional regulator, RpiR family [Beutenbergia cavernae DSM 12333]
MPARRPGQDGDDAGSSSTAVSAAAARSPRVVAHADDASPLQALRDALPSLTGALARAAAHIVDAPAEASRGSITRLATASGVSPATLTRLAGLLGYDGFPAMRAAIATEHGREVQGGWQRDIGTAIAPDDPADQVLGVLVAHSSRAARNAMGALDLAGATRAADWIAAAERIHLYGEWGDSVSLHELYLRLLRIGRPVWFHEGKQATRVAASLLRPGDVAIALSRAGHDAVGEAFCALAQENGAHTVVITGDPEGPLADVADLVLFTGTREGTAWTDYFAGRASDTLTAALLWVLVAQRVPDALGVEFAVPHSHPRSAGTADRPHPTTSSTKDLS